MRPHLPLPLLSALLACLVSPSWANYTLTGNGETTISFADDQYVITLPTGDPVTLTESPEIIYLTDITATGTYEGGYERTLNLEGGTYSGIQVYNVAGNAGESVTIENPCHFTLNIGAGTSFLNSVPNQNFMLWSSNDRIIPGNFTVNVDRNAGTINGFSIIGDGNMQNAFQTTGTYTVNIHGGNWNGVSVGNPDSS